MADGDVAELDECDRFYQRHRGGSGAIILVEAFDARNPTRQAEHIGVFSSIELAQLWG